jgi:hypothetical protein
MQNRDLSFVVQGAIDHEISPLTGAPITQSCLAGLRRHHPGAEIVLSTWKDEDTAGLDYDQLVLNDDPGAWNALRPGTRATKLDNTNRQIVSTKSGLCAATRKYAAKIRSDMIFIGNEWMTHVNRYPHRSHDWRIFRERVITCSMWARDPRCPFTDQPFHPPDWVHIGLREDILLLWDIPLQPEPESSQWFLNRPVNLPPPGDEDIRRYSPEQYLWCTLLRKYGDIPFRERGDNSAENIRITELSFANNLIILDLPQFPFVVHKYPYPVSPRYRYYRFISHKQWKWLYYEHSARQRLEARLLALTDPHYYAKMAYSSIYSPLQAFRKIARLPRTA